MTEHDILSIPGLDQIYDCLTKGWQHSPRPDLTKRQAVTIIKKILLHKALVHHKAPKWFVVTLTSDETERLHKLLKAKYERLGLNKSDEEIKQEAEVLNELFDKVVETQITKGSNNG